MSMPPALESEVRPFTGEAWRVVESRSQVSTMKIVDTLFEQAILEAELDGSKPAFPESCADLDYLLATPFRYAPHPYGSRFRRAGQREGCLYCSERVETAVAEAAFHQLQFFLASPDTPLLRNPQERTAFRLSVSTRLALDTTARPLSDHRAIWVDPTGYAPCQDLADAARKAEVEIIRYESVRDPERGANLAVLSPGALASHSTATRQTWRFLLRRDRIDAVREMPKDALSFGLAAWASVDPRVPAALRP